MKRLHLVIGLLFTAVFLGSGVYLRLTFEHVFGNDPALQAILRSVHIYILLAALLCGILGIHLLDPPEGLRGLLQRLGSIGIILSPIVLTVAFVVAAVTRESVQYLVGPALLMAMGGCLLHLIAHARFKSYVRRS